MRAPSITIAHGVCDATGSHTKSFSSLRYDMPWPIYAGTMLHDWCEANGFSKYEKAVAAYCDDLDDVADLEISDIVSITESTNMPHVKKRKFENAVEVVKRNRTSGAPLSAIQARRWMLYVLSRHRDWSVWIMCVRHPLKIPRNRIIQIVNIAMNATQSGTRHAPHPAPSARTHTPHGRARARRRARARFDDAIYCCRSPLLMASAMRRVLTPSHSPLCDTICHGLFMQVRCCRRQVARARRGLSTLR